MGPGALQVKQISLLQNQYCPTLNKSKTFDNVKEISGGKKNEIKT